MPTLTERIAYRRDALLSVLLASVALVGNAWAVDFDNGFRLGGALRYNYAYKDWDPKYNGTGLIDFDYSYRAYGIWLVLSYLVLNVAN